jgi:glutamyl-Q tRNA(Asp) synthetase
MAYWCGCSRSDLPASGVYPGTCKNGLAKGKRPRALRIRTNSGPISFTDRIQGEVSQDLGRDCGDFVIRRADGYFAYQLAVVIDDAEQHITQVVRGADLLDSTARQIWLQQCLRLPTPSYAHVPLVVQNDGKKLSKSLKADPLRNSERLASLQMALKMLGHEPPKSGWSSTWEWALAHWSLDRIPPGNVPMPD